MDIINEYFKEQCGKILKEAVPTSLTLSLEIFNPKLDSSEFLVTPFIIDKLVIQQLFYYNIVDDIVVNLKFLPNDVYAMFDSVESLKCRMTMKFIEHDTGEVNEDLDYILREYNVHIPNFDDLNKRFSKTEITNEDEDTEPYLEQQHGTTIPLTIQLLDPVEFVFRKKLVNMGFQKVTVQSALFYICTRFGLKNLKYDDGMNERVYQNFHIPQEYGRFRNIFEYIHKKYGVYDKGLSYYFFSNFFYIYKPFENKINPSEPVINIYKVPNLFFGNSRNYHTVIDGDLWIICDTDIEYKNISLTNLENNGTDHIFLKADWIIDGHREVTEDKVTIKKNLTDVQITDNMSRVNERSVTVNYQKPTLNHLYQTSLVAEKSTAILNLIWKFAVPFMIFPGQFVNFYYQKGDEIIQQTGRVENIGYTVERQQQTISQSPIFGVQANMQIRLTLM